MHSDWALDLVTYEVESEHRLYSWQLFRINKIIIARTRFWHSHFACCCDLTMSELPIVFGDTTTLCWLPSEDDPSKWVWPIPNSSHYSTPKMELTVVSNRRLREVLPTDTIIDPNMVVKAILENPHLAVDATEEEKAMAEKHPPQMHIKKNERSGPKKSKKKKKKRTREQKSETPPHIKAKLGKANVKMSVSRQMPRRPKMKPFNSKAKSRAYLSGAEAKGFFKKSKREQGMMYMNAKFAKAGGEAASSSGAASSSVAALSYTEGGGEVEASSSEAASSSVCENQGVWRDPSDAPLRTLPPRPPPPPKKEKYKSGEVELKPGPKTNRPFSAFPQKPREPVVLTPKASVQHHAWKELK